MAADPVVPHPGARSALEAERDELRTRLTGLVATFDDIVAATLDANTDDEHDPEGTTIAFERSQVDATVRAVRAHLAEVDTALARIDAGTYGTCERCGRPIGAARLEARPIARLCIACAALRDR